MASTYLSNTGSGSGATTCTFSAWVKRAKTQLSGLSPHSVFGGYYGSNANRIALHFDNNSQSFIVYIQDNAGTGSEIYLVTNRQFRDVNAWYHIVVEIDTTQATSTDRVKLYINGVQETSFSSSTYPSQNYVLKYMSSSATSYVGNGGNSSNNYYFDGSMAHVHFIDGTAYTASTFGESDTNGVWKPKTAPSVTYGTNGFFLKFENSGSMGTDSSGNGNNFTVNGNLTQTLDTPSNVYCTNNVLSLSASGVTNANGNLSVTSNASNGWRDLFGTFGASLGKWYWEQKIDNFATGLNPHYIGICDESYFNNSATGTNFENSGVPRAYGYTKTGDKINANSVTSYGNSWTTGDIVGIAMDLDNGKIYFSKNGTWQNSGDPTSGATGTGSAFNVTTGYTYLPLTATYYNDNRYSYNFGNGYFGTTAVSSAGSNGNGSIFEYDVPTGYYALNTKNLATYG